jgi:hypothetical protein
MKVGLKLAVVVAALVASSLAFPTFGYAIRGHHHRPGQHHHVSTPSPATPSATLAASCVALPNPVQLSMTSALGGGFGAAIQCQGFVASDVVTFTAPRLSGACGSVSFNGAGPAVTTMVDLFGRATASVTGIDCSAGDYSVQVFGPNESVDALLTLHLF